MLSVLALLQLNNMTPSPVTLLKPMQSVAPSAPVAIRVVLLSARPMNSSPVRPVPICTVASNQMDLFAAGMKPAFRRWVCVPSWAVEILPGSSKSRRSRNRGADGLAAGRRVGGRPVVGRVVPDERLVIEDAQVGHEQVAHDGAVAPELVLMRRSGPC